MRSLDLPAHSPATALDLYNVIGPKLRESEDWKSGEGPRSFVEKWRPIWKGR